MNIHTIWNHHPQRVMVSRAHRSRITRTEWWVDRIQAQCELLVFELVKLSLSALLGALIALAAHH